jgi:diguanylate cyclase (GGDEF)-like protein
MRKTRAAEPLAADVAARADQRESAKSAAEQTAADLEQTLSDLDQTASDQDQSASDRDALSADEDQQVVDAELALGTIDAASHERSTAARAQTAENRDAVSQLRDETAQTRLQSADERDRLAEERDRLAELRDEAARVAEALPLAVGEEERIARLRHAADRAAQDRVRAALDRARAAQDRAAAAADRAEAQQARREAREQFAWASTDELTGAWTRKFGLEHVAHEIERARRTGSTLSLAFIDVDGLKQVNDHEGHAAGDALLRQVGATLRKHLRSYDLLVRFGGDEFLCLLPNASLRTAAERLAQVADELLAAPEHPTGLSFGLAELADSDSFDDLLGRADKLLIEGRRLRGRAPRNWSTRA